MNFWDWQLLTEKLYLRMRISKSFSGLGWVTVVLQERFEPVGYCLCEEGRKKRTQLSPSHP